MFTPLDIQMMRQALTLAREGRFSTSPNPRVGCVIARGSQIVGQGFHVQAGAPHAEVHALHQAGPLAQGATAYVTLEPCSHHGRTPPCADGLIAAGIGRVVAAMRDPNPLVAGQGLRKLQTAGIETACGLLENEARKLNRGFLSRIERGRPFFRLKCAASLDGRTALSDGRSQWITGQAARDDVQILRAESCAVLTGIGTVLADNPQLTVRAFPVLRPPLRIVLDSRLRISADSRLLQDDSAPVLIATCCSNGRRQEELAALPHVRILHCAADSNGRILLPQLAVRLAEEGLGEIMVEAGAELNAAFLQAGLADEIVLYQAPKILGAPARPLFALPEQADALSVSSEWQSRSVELLGQDLKWVLRRN